jgi:hypothetical protein
MKRTSALKASAVLLSAGMVAGFILVPFGRAPQLRQVGKQIPMPRGYAIYGDWGQHLWISEHDQMNISFWRINIADKGKPPRIKIMSQAMRFDMDTGKALPITKINNRLIADQKQGIRVHIEWWQPSFDGKWVAFVDGLNHPTYYGLIALDGSLCLRRPRDSEYRMPGMAAMQWTCESSAFYLASHGDTNFRHTHADLISSNAFEHPESLAFASPDEPATELGFTDRGRILALIKWPYGRIKPDESIHLAEFDPHIAGGALRQWILKPPPGGKVEQIALSSRGDKLAWLILTKNQGPRVAFLRKSLDLMGYKVQDSISLWISNLNGSQMKEIAAATVGPQPWGGGLAWSPSDKKISFVLDVKNIWVVPVH